MKACLALALLVAAALGAAESASPAQEPAGDLASPAVPPAGQLVAALRNATSANDALQLAIAAGRTVAVNSSRALWDALQDEPRGHLVVELQGDLALDDPVWDTGSVFIQPGRAVALKTNLSTDSVDVRENMQAIQEAGAHTLNFTLREEALVVQPGAALLLDGLVLRGNAPRTAWLAKKPLYPNGLGANPSIVALPNATNVHRWVSSNFQQDSCDPSILEGITFRVGLLVGNASNIHYQGGSAYSVTGPVTFDINLFSGDGSGTIEGQTHVLAQDVVLNCTEDPSAPGAAVQPESVGTADGGSGSGLADWVWVLVALGSAALLSALFAAALLVQRRRRRRRSLTESGNATPPEPQGCQAEDIAMHSPTDKDLEKAIMPSESELAGPLLHLREAWRSRIGAVHGLELLEPIGRGGFATVWKARWRGSFVSAKIIEHGLSGGVLEAIQREASISCSVSHPNIIATYKVATLNLGELSNMHAERPQLEVQATPSHLPGSSADAGGASQPAALALPAPTSSSAGSQASSAAQRVRSFLSRLTRSVGSRAIRLSPPGSAGAPSVAPAQADGASPTAGQLGPAGSLPDVLTVDEDKAAHMGATLILQELCSRSVEDCMADGHVLYIDDGSPAPLAVVRMLIDAAQGLDHLSVCGIVHGDVKAGNVLLCSTGGNRRGWQAKIADLGLSRMLPPDATSMPASTEAGTAAYMAPEVLTGRLTRAADVYSFGVLMYEVWTRRRAWEGRPLPQLIFAVVSERSRPPVPEGCPGGYSSLMQQCWAQAPEDRPTFEQVLKSLQELLRLMLKDGQQDRPTTIAELNRPRMMGSIL